jgi:hypothetical protein
MNKKALAIIILQALVIVTLAWALVFYGKDEYEVAQHADDKEISSPARGSEEHGATVVTLTEAAQKASGITTTTLQSASHQNELTSYGSVVGIEPLTELRSRYQAALADASVVRASIINTQQDYQRLKALNGDNKNISDRAVQVAEAAWKADQARLAAAETQAAGIRDNMRQQWGDILANGGGGAEALQSHQQVLVQVALPDEAGLNQIVPASISRITIAATGTHGKPIPATYIGPSPQTDPTMQGRTYFFRASSQDLRAGMRIEAHIQLQGTTRQGVMIPTDAVVWYLGKAWAYRKQGTEKFVRQLVNTEQSADNGWFDPVGFKEGDMLVTSGAQLLLSEELKFQIKNENDD